MAFIEAVQQEADAKAEAALAKQAAKRKAEDDKIRSAKRSCLEKRRLKNEGRAIYGDVSKTAEEFGVDRRALRTALEQPGRDDVRALTLGRPPNITPAQAHFAVKEIEQRALRSRSIPEPVLAAALGAMAVDNNSAFNSDNGSSQTPSRRTLERFKNARGLIKVITNETDKARLAAISKTKVQAFFNHYNIKVLMKNILLAERRRHGNLDETPLSGRGEKLARRLYALVTKMVMARKKGAAIRSEAIGDGNEVMSFIPFTLADGTVLVKIFLVAADKVNPKWTAPPPKNMKGSSEFLPRMPLDYFDKGDVAIYATECGVMTTEVFEKMLIDVIVPRWRSLIPDDPLCLHMDAPEQHTMSPQLAGFLKEKEIICNFFPHKTSTALQPLDLLFNLKWRAKFRSYVDALITVAQNSHAYLNDKLQALFMRRK